MPEREVEVEDRSKQPGAILRDAERAIRLHAREDKGRFGEDGLDLDTAVKIIEILRDELVAALDRVRDARGDDEAGLARALDAYDRHGDVESQSDHAAAMSAALAAARSPQGEDHENCPDCWGGRPKWAGTMPAPPCPTCSGTGKRSPQGESDEGGNQ